MSTEPTPAAFPWPLRAVSAVADLADTMKALAEAERKLADQRALNLSLTRALQNTNEELAALRAAQPTPPAPTFARRTDVLTIPAPLPAVKPPKPPRPGLASNQTRTKPKAKAKKKPESPPVTERETIACSECRHAKKNTASETGWECTLSRYRECLPWTAAAHLSPTPSEKK